ncbi:hypothetical protein QWY28_17260 [Nocardioides sp. SOB77]|uniref:DUF222 domain-containing protein n=1 Tax=Nocardioides oceani TaxID=3058369 RepID=A0ABT8FJ54_9ACTN|nr:hypothetical protein [Nocardioides oceani]MDN4174713.1 hypothetical protein [Nocardioides oceani]
MNATSPDQHAAETVDVATVQAEISSHLTRLLVLSDDVELLTDTVQRGRGFLTAEGRKILDQQTRREKRDLRAQPARRSDDGAPVVGLAWLNRTSMIAGTGDVAAPGNFRGIAAAADMWFTVSQHVRRMTRSLLAANRPVPAWTEPTAPTFTDLVNRHRQLVHAAPSLRLLQPIARELEHLVQQAELVVEGNDRAVLDSPCPHCELPTLVRYLQQGVTRCELDHTSRSSRPWPCVCPDPMCACKRDAVTHRHEWLDNPKTKTEKSIHDLYGLINHQKKVTEMETKALDAVTSVRQLHRPIEIQPPADQCPGPDQPEDPTAEPPAPHVHQDGICIDCPPLLTACTHCTHETDPQWTAYPCPTLTLINEATGDQDEAAGRWIR